MLADGLLSAALGAGSVIYNILFSKREKGLKKVFIAREDFKFITLESERNGVLSSFERRMIDHVIDFQAVTVRQVMQPVAALRMIRAGMTVDEVLEISLGAHVDHLPVVSEAGVITGLVNVFELLVDSKGGSESIATCVRRILSVAPDEPAYGVMRKLRAARTKMAAVIDINAGLVGFVASEELIKRLIGSESN